MDFDPEEFTKQQFKAAQRPVAWLRSAERLRDAAEAILTHELPAEIAYSQALKVAEQEANAIAYSDGNDTGEAEIMAIPPNYPPAQLLYAYAIENALKGLIISMRPDLIDESKLKGELKTHDLIKLAVKAKLAIHERERPVLEALSQLSTWVGRYPVALTLTGYNVRTWNPNELLRYGSAHPIMRAVFERARRELESRVPKEIGNCFELLVLFRQPV